MNPLIGITCSHQWEEPRRFYVHTAYVQAVAAAGGIPVLVPYQDDSCLEAILGQIAGLLVPGGSDLDSSHFNQELHPKSGIIDPWRDCLDLAMIRGALARELPILAVCRGSQVLNVACGGSLIQDIESQIQEPIKHQQQAPAWYPTHEVAIEAGSLLARIFETTSLRVNSFHHQALDQIASGFRVSAAAGDGVVEAIESVNHRFVLGVQGHPELMINGDPAMGKLFVHFVGAAKER